MINATVSSESIDSNNPIVTEYETDQVYSHFNKNAIEDFNLNQLGQYYQ